MTKKVSIHFLPLPKPATSGDTRPPEGLEGAAAQEL